jgi:hypothetical protein
MTMLELVAFLWPAWSRFHLQSHVLDMAWGGIRALTYTFVKCLR